MTGGRHAEQEVLMRAALPHVAFDGWSRTALSRGTADAGLPAGDDLRLFPGGAAELFQFFSAWADAQLATRPPREPHLHERVRSAVRTRIDTMAPWREAVRRGVAFAAFPAQGSLGLRCLYRTVDEIWFVAGDRSADFSFYTKRASLAAIYAATVLYWLDDRSEGSGETWSFLDRRIADIGRLRGYRRRLEKFVDGLPDPRRFAAGRGASR